MAVRAIRRPLRLPNNGLKLTETSLRFLTAPGFLLRPQLNSATLGGRRVDAMSGGPHLVFATLGEWGLFTGEMPNRKPPPVLDLPPNVRQDVEAVHVDGLPTPLQFFRVTLTPSAGGVPSHHVVASAYPPFPPDSVPDATRRVLPACLPSTLSLIVEDQVGWARATSATGAPPHETAAAVAHVKVVAGWDETEPVVVTVDGEAWQVLARFQEGRWQLAVSRAW